MKVDLSITSLLLILGILLAVGFLTGAIKLGCAEREDNEQTSDSLFVRTTREAYRPTSLPFESESRRPASLPEPVIEDARSVLQIVKKIPVDSARSVLDTTTVVLGEDLRMRVVDNGTEVSVQETEVLPPWLSLERALGLGVSVSDGLRPSLSYSLVRIAGVVDLPVLSVDPTGVAAGIGYRHRELLISAGYHLRFKGADRGVTIAVHYLL